jgi:hypothetical protein
MTTDNERLREALHKCRVNRPAAHKIIFQERHKDVTPPFHALYQTSFFDPTISKLLYWIFRGGAKSSIAEECLGIGANFKQFNNAVIVGANETRASERLIAIRHELQYNERLISLFGEQVGEMWSDTKLVLSNGVMIQAIGQGQDLRGIKYLQFRPDFALLDDLEKREDAWTPAARAKIKRWYFGEFFPALDPKALVRMNATPLDEEALSVTFSKLPDWKTIVVPILYKDEHTGEEKSSWEERYPLHWIAQTRKAYEDAGELDMFNREYLLQSTSNELKVFKKEYFKYAHHSRSYEAVFAIYDPARTAKATSAHTGYVVYSWLGNKLVVWESGGNFWQPSEIIDHIFSINEKYNPVFIAVEKDGLEEFILQPLRQESSKRNITVPIKDVRAPKGKTDFIKALEPFFKASEVILVGSSDDHKTLTSQLENFPTGRIDVPNALAYAPRLRIGAPVYEDFTNEHVTPELNIVPNEPFYLAVNATPTSLAAILCQFVRGTIRVYTDYVAEGDPSLTLAPAIQHAQLFCGGKPLRLIAPRQHFTHYDNIGLRAAVRAIPTTVSQGGDLHKGMEQLRRLLRSSIRGGRAFQVDPGATFVLRALAGGYAFSIDRTGALAPVPAENAYATTMNALEALLAVVSSENLRDDNSDASGYAFTQDGRKYRTSKAT